jgi:hypothetical protein
MPQIFVPFGLAIQVEGFSMGSGTITNIAPFTKNVNGCGTRKFNRASRAGAPGIAQMSGHVGALACSQRATIEPHE